MDNIHGISARDWWQLLKSNKFSVDRAYLLRLFMISITSINNSRFIEEETRQYHKFAIDCQVNEPIFILGHWRSGTTLLHNLLTHGNQFAFPNLFQVLFPHRMISGEKEYFSRYKEAGPTKRTMDNVSVTMHSPGEDEFALSSLTQLSPVISWSFPRTSEYYDRYITLQTVSRTEIDRWKTTLLKIYKKLSWRYGKQLVLKSPVHTARIRLLLSLFPDAKFIHIARNPFDVFQSMQKLYRTAVANSRLQEQKEEEDIEEIIRRYRKINRAYIEEKNSIPNDNLVEIKFEDLISNKLDVIALIYDTLNLPRFNDIEPGLKDYIEILDRYEVNEYPPLQADLQGSIVESWGFCFEAWNYSTTQRY